MENTLLNGKLILLNDLRLYALYTTIEINVLTDIDKPNKWLCEFDNQNNKKTPRGPWATSRN